MGEEALWMTASSCRTDVGVSCVVGVDVGVEVGRMILNGVGVFSIKTGPLFLVASGGGRAEGTGVITAARTFSGIRPRRFEGKLSIAEGRISQTAAAASSRILPNMVIFQVCLRANV